MEEVRDAMKRVEINGNRNTEYGVLLWSQSYRDSRTSTAPGLPHGIAAAPEHPSVPGSAAATVRSYTFFLIMSGSFMSQILQPGGGIMLAPFVRAVVFALLLLTLTAAVLDVARIHMVVLSVLSSGLLLSLSFFENEVKKQQQRGGHTDSTSMTTTATTTSSSSCGNNKTD